MNAGSRLRGRPKSFHSDASKNVIQSLDRAIDVLDTLAAGGAMTLSEIATSMGQSPATIYRVLTTFQLRAIAEVDPASQEWSIGPAAFRLGSAFLRRSNVTERARPAMRRLMEMTNETSNLGIEKADLVMFISQVETHESIRAFFPPGTQSPMHASGIGKALLSCYPPDRLKRLLSRSDLEPFTPQTITDPENLRRELSVIQATGYAFDNEEKAEGMRCIAAPILDYHGEAVAGISISGPSHRITLDRIEPIGKMVHEAARQVSQTLGGGPG